MCRLGKPAGDESMMSVVSVAIQGGPWSIVLACEDYVVSGSRSPGVGGMDARGRRLT